MEAILLALSFLNTGLVVGLMRKFNRLEEELEMDPEVVIAAPSPPTPDYSTRPGNPWDFPVPRGSNLSPEPLGRPGGWSL